MKKLHMLFDSIGVEELKMNERKEGTDTVFKWTSYTVSKGRRGRTGRKY